MAVTVLQQPTSPNVTGTNLVYTLSSGNSSQPQFRYITDVYPSGSVTPSTRIARIQTYPNIYGSGIVDVAQILSDNLEYDKDWKTSSGALATDSFKTFDLRFGESYGTSISSSEAVTPGTTSNYLQVFPGTVYSNKGSYNYTPISTFHGLTNQPTGSICKGNHLTIPLYVPSSAARTPSNIVVQFLDEDGALLAQRISGDLDLSDVSIYQYPIGSGSNFTLGNFENLDWETLKVNISGSNEPITQWKRVRPCHDECTTFVFTNDYGYYDYYSIANPVRRATNVDRNIYKKIAVDYTSYESGYNITNRGEKQYYTEYSDRYVITTDFLNKETADWLEELFNSTDVYLQENGYFVPLNILNTQQTWNMNENRQKLFQYEIEFMYSDKRISR